MSLEIDESLRRRIKCMYEDNYSVEEIQIILGRYESVSPTTIYKCIKDYVPVFRLYQARTPAEIIAFIDERMQRDQQLTSKQLQRLIFDKFGKTHLVKIF